MGNISSYEFILGYLYPSLCLDVDILMLIPVLISGLITHSTLEEWSGRSCLSQTKGFLLAIYEAQAENTTTGESFKIMYFI